MKRAALRNALVGSFFNALQSENCGVFRYYYYTIQTVARVFLLLKTKGTFT